MTIAICICTCDRPNSLQELLNVLVEMELGQLHPGELFFVVVDNRPDGRAQAVCDQARARLPGPLYFAEEQERGISFARNRAISTALAQGAEWIAFIDDDDRPRPDWLVHLVNGSGSPARIWCMGSGSCPTTSAFQSRFAGSSSSDHQPSTK